MFLPPLIRLIRSSFGWSATNISSRDGADQWRIISLFQIRPKPPSCISAALRKYFSHTCISGSATDHQEEFAEFSSLLKDTSEGSGMRDSRTLQPKSTTWATSGGGADWQLHRVGLCVSLWGWYCSSHVSSAQMRDSWPPRVKHLSPASPSSTGTPPCCEVWHLLTVTVKTGRRKPTRSNVSKHTT